MSCALPFAVLHSSNAPLASSRAYATQVSTSASESASSVVQQFVQQAANSVPWANAGTEGAPHIEMMGAAGASLVSSIATELKLKKAELEGIAYTLAMSTASVAVQVNNTQRRLDQSLEAIEGLRLQVAARSKEAEEGSNTLDLLTYRP